MRKKSTGLQRLLNATRQSLKGLKATWRGETAFRQEIWLVAVLLPVALWLGETVTQKALLVLTCFLILIVELVNSAIETVVDRVGLEEDPLSGKAKDMGSAAVLLCLLAAAAVWIMVGWQRWMGE